MKSHTTGFLFAVFFFCASVSAQTQTISFVRGTSYNISLSGPGFHFRIPVELPKGTDSSNARVSLLDVHSERFTDSVPITVFTNPFLADTLGNSFLNIDINNSPPIIPASYVLNLRCKKTADPSSVPEKYTLTIIINAAVVSSPGTVLVEREGRIGAGFDCTDTLLHLNETSRRSPLTNITLRTVKMLDDKNRTVSGKIILRPGQTIKAGEPGDLVFDLKGEFPVGKTTAAMELRGNQIADAIPLTFEITTRRGAAFLIGLLLLGLLAGYVVRILLTNIIALNEARLPGFELLSILESSLSNRADTKFVDAVAAIKKTLKEGLGKKKVDEVTKSITDAKSALEKAINDFNTGIAASQHNLDALQNTANAIAALPNRFSSVNADAPSLVAAIRESIVKGKISEADALISTTNKKLAQDFYQVLSQYKQNCLNLLNEVGHAGFSIPEIMPVIEQINNKFSAIDTTATSAIDIALFTDIRWINQKLGDLLYGLGRSLRNTMFAILEQFKPVEGIMPDPHRIAELGKQADAIIAEINAITTEPEAGLRVLPDKLYQLKTNLRKSFLRQTDDEGEPDEHKKEENKNKRDVIEKEINADNYLAAATAVVEFVKAYPSKGRGKSVDPFVAPVEIIQNLQAEVAGLFPLQQQTVQNVSTIWTPGSVNTELRYEKVVSVISTAKITQAVLIGAVIMFVGYTLYADKFIGTTPEIASVFFWAFLINVSLTTLTDGFFSKIVKP